ncbi:MAG: SEC-C domain-containing protein [Ilumatobacteraceae bacterium]
MTDAHDHPHDHPDDHPDEAFAAAVRDAISDGPRPLDELAAQLHAAGALDRYIAEISDDDDATGSVDGGDDDDTGNTRPGWIIDLRDDLLLDVAGIWVDDDDGVHLAVSAFDGVILTHRVDPDEIERGALDATPDLAAIATGLEGEIPLLGPVPGWVHLAYPFSRDDDIADELGSFIGPDGWLHDVAPGRLVALRRVGDAIELNTDVELDEPNEPPDDEPSTAAGPGDPGAERRDDTAVFLLSRYERLVEPGIGVDVDELVLETIVRGSASFRRVLPPISDQLAQVGLHCVDGFVGPVDEEFAPGYDDEFGDGTDDEFDDEFSDGSDDDVDRVGEMADKYRLNSCCREALEVAVDGLEQMDESLTGGPPPHAVVAGVADALRHGPTVPLLEQYVLDDRDGIEVERLGVLGRALVNAGTRTAGVGHNLLGLYELHTGGAVAALDHLERAVGLDGPETPAAMELAALRTDTGDARRALDAWRRTPSAPGRDEHVATLSELLSHLDGVRRNDPCPCGSGRKFKQCCAIDPKLGPAERRRLALFRVGAHAAGRLDDRRFGLALTAVGAEDPDDRPRHDHDHDHHHQEHHHDHDHDESDVVASLRRWQADPLLLDLVVHEDGGLEGYLDERGELVPDDVRAWLTSLLDQPRTLWEVTVTDPAARSATARSVLTDERFEVQLREVDPHIGGHAHVVGRLVPDAVDGGPGFVGIVHVVPTGLARATVHLVDNSPTSDELAAWAAGGSVSPTLPDPEGEPLPMATLHLGLVDDDRDRSRTALDQQYLADGDDRWRQVVDLGEHPDPEVTVATLELTADELIATVHGGGRLGRLRDELETAGFTWIRADLNPEVA